MLLQVAGPRHVGEWQDTHLLTGMRCEWSSLPACRTRTVAIIRKTTTLSESFGLSKSRSMTQCTLSRYCQLALEMES